MTTTDVDVVISGDVAELIASVLFPVEGPGLPVVNLATGDPEAIKKMGDLLAKAKSQLGA